MTPYTVELNDDIAAKLAALPDDKQRALAHQINAFVSALLQAGVTENVFGDLPPLTARETAAIRAGIADARMGCILEARVVLPELFRATGVASVEADAKKLPGCIFAERARETIKEGMHQVRGRSLEGAQRFTRAMETELQTLCAEVAAQCIPPVFDEAGYLDFALPVYQRCFTVQTRHRRASCEVWRLFYTLDTNIPVVLALLISGAEHLDEWLLSDDTAWRATW